MGTEGIDSRKSRTAVITAALILLAAACNQVRFVTDLPVAGRIAAEALRGFQNKLLNGQSPERKERMNHERIPRTRPH